MTSEFEMTDLGHLSYFFGMKFKRSKEGLFMHQSKYATDLLRRFKMLQCNSVVTPADPGFFHEKENNEDQADHTYFRQIVGSLRYLCTSRPDLVYAVGLVSRYMESPSNAHLLAAKRVLKYVK